MKSDYIVTEPAVPAARRHAPKLAIGAGIFALAFYFAGERSDGAMHVDADETSQVQADISLVAQTSPARSLFDDIAPISAAQAAVTPPNAALDDNERSPAALLDLATAPLGSVSETPEDTTLVRLESRELTVKSGDSLSILFDRNGLKPNDWMALAALKGDAKRLLRLRPGDKLMLGLDDEQRVAALDMRIDDTQTLSVRRDENGKFQQSVLVDDISAREVAVEGVIDNSLFLSAKAAGLSDRLTMELTDIFAWDVDFALDIRAGDRFRVIYEELYRDGKPLKEGKILAAEFSNRGRMLRAVRYIDSDDRAAYYAPDGKPMKKAFLRSPVDFTRISSRFSLGRKHPILNKIRAHKGVDYAAPRGTPIKAAGAGKVVFAGNKGGYGRVVILQHAGKYRTLYAHLNGFRRGIRKGVSVSQGDTIAYVGMSGLATGPHLHYEFLVGDRHVDPLSVKLPSAPQIASSEMARFESQTATLLAKLDEFAPSSALVASAADDEQPQP